MKRTPRQPVRVGPYPFWFIAFQSLCALAAVASLIIGVSNGVANNRQDAEARAANQARDEQTASLLDCFDVLLGRSAVRSRQIGAAAERVTTETLERDRAKYRWIALLNRALALDPAEGSEAAIAIGIRFQKRTTELLDAQREVIRAQLAQEKVRERFPVPPPPSAFCEVDGVKPSPATSKPSPKPSSKPTPSN